MTLDVFLEKLDAAICENEELAEEHDVETRDLSGFLTMDKGLHVTLKDGSEFYMSVQRYKGPDNPADDYDDEEEED